MSSLAWFWTVTLRALGIVFGTLAAYLVSLGIYRLYFSPIAKFPGPPLAALSFWYEFYYDVIREGSYTWRIREMHAKYGE
jgi:hypothetical protein